MKTWILRTRTRQALVALAVVFGLLPLTSSAQDRLKTMPGYEQYQKMVTQTKGAVKAGVLNSVAWDDDGQAFRYQQGGKVYRYDIAAGKATVIGEAKGD